MNELFSVQDKVVLVAGGSRGIGRAIATAFQDSEAKVVVCARSEAELRATGLTYQVCDITESGQIKSCIKYIVERFGRLDVLFNVAGINFRHAAASFPDEQLEKILAINVQGNFMMASNAGRIMISQGSGKIINIASLHTHQSLTGVSAYAASKGAIGSMTRALAVEWAQFNVQVNAIAPGIIRTDLNAKLWEDPTLLKWVEQRTPAARLGKTEDLIGASIFLASSASDFITGQVLYVDGGLTAGQTWPLEIPR
jgi:gluconate 5-dehydrogenase